MKSISLSGFLLFCFSFALMAQDKFMDKPPEERAAIQTEWMSQELGLDSLTAEKTHEINYKYAVKVDELRNSSMSRASKYNEIRSLADLKEKDLKNIFTGDQFELYKIKKEEFKSEIKSQKKNNSQ